MKIKVFNDQKEVFKGNSQEFLSINDNDLEIVDMMQEAKEKGESERKFFSGNWLIIHHQ